MKHAGTIQIAFLSIIILTLTGCFSSNPADIEAFMKPYETDVTSDNYVLQPPDIVMVLCSDVPEVHEQEQQIRPDGKISFENLGEIEAAGKTVSELRDAVKEKVLELYQADYISENSIDVKITAFRSKMYYVLGQVNFPGPKVYTGRDSVLTAVATAQLNPMAWKERIQVIRPSSKKDEDPYIFEINFDRLEAHGQASKNVLLEEGDIVYVPPTVLGAIGLKIEEILTPIARAFTGSYIIQSGGTVGGSTF